MPIPNKGNAKECSDYCKIVLISHANKVKLKMIQARLQQYMNREHPDGHTRFRKGRETRDQLVNICWITEKGREFQKNIYFCFIDYTKAFLWITKKCGTFLKRWEYQTTLPASWETHMQVKKQVRTVCGTMDWFKIGKGKCQSLTPWLFNSIWRVHHVNCWAG